MSFFQIGAHSARENANSIIKLSNWKWWDTHTPFNDLFVKIQFCMVWPCHDARFLFNRQSTIEPTTEKKFNIRPHQIHLLWCAWNATAFPYNYYDAFTSDECERHYSRSCIRNRHSKGQRLNNMHTMRYHVIIIQISQRRLNVQFVALARSLARTHTNTYKTEQLHWHCVADTVDKKHVIHASIAPKDFKTKQNSERNHKKHNQPASQHPNGEQTTKIKTTRKITTS